jgi:2-iminobutanoate/2-iminopropanoate deaminase
MARSRSKLSLLRNLSISEFVRLDDPIRPRRKDGRYGQLFSFESGRRTNGVLNYNRAMSPSTDIQRRDINAETAPLPTGAFSQAVEVSGGTRILFVSGQVGIEADGSAPAGMAEQARLAWRNLEQQLKAAGMGFENLVKVTMIIPDPADIAAGRLARADVLGDCRPASTIVVAGLADPAWKIEIEGIAYA